MATLTLSWTSPGGPNVTGFNAFYRIRGGGSYTAHSGNPQSAATTSVTWTVSENTIYEAYVETICTVGGPTPATEAEAIRFTCPIVAPTGTDHDSISYSFTHLGGSVNAYDVILYASDGTTVLETDNITAPSGTISGTFGYAATASTAYKIKVIPKATGDIAYSKTDCALVDVTTSPTPTCAAPTGVSASIS